MHPTMGLKFLRDGMDSGNIVANLNFAGGQHSYNYFESSLTTALQGEEGFDMDSLKEDPIALVIKPTTVFIHSVGVSDLA